MSITSWHQAPFPNSPFLNHLSFVVANPIACEMDCSVTSNSKDPTLDVLPLKVRENSSMTAESEPSNLSRKGRKLNSYNKGKISLYLTILSNSFTNQGSIQTGAIIAHTSTRFSTNLKSTKKNFRQIFEGVHDQLHAPISTFFNGYALIMRYSNLKRLQMQA